MSKLEYAKCAAASLAYLILQQQDSVGLVTFDREIRALVRPSSNPSHLKQLLHVMETSPGERKTAAGPIFHDLAERFKKRGIVVVFSDLFDDVRLDPGRAEALSPSPARGGAVSRARSGRARFSFRPDDAVPRPGRTARSAGRAARLAAGVSRRVQQVPAPTQARLPRSSGSTTCRCGRTNRWRLCCRAIWRRGGKASKESLQGVKKHYVGPLGIYAEIRMPQSNLPVHGPPNSSISEYNKGGVRVRRRFFGADGKATKNVDYLPHHGHPVPHAHDWDWTKDPPRQPARALKPGE